MLVLVIASSLLNKPTKPEDYDKMGLYNTEFGIFTVIDQFDGKRM